MCQCYLGYSFRQDNTTYTVILDIECQEQPSRCFKTTNTLGSYKCTCRPGYSGMNTTAQDPSLTREHGGVGVGVGGGAPRWSDRPRGVNTAPLPPALAVSQEEAYYNFCI
ncbi:fibrillin-1-like [Polyodon spathula]|uniref:fibrillin-1-like n=1 Tax=Polyodon spathula TaxID=7913 RepID=UPI001B7E039B|nr:fibrillin-1-like [Polyodon spathula]XP_041110295.1 fibrillin-1-like [Polyodon spathula]XP_041110296.1 fibrillin-1-like [Polyodon spathula]